MERPSSLVVITGAGTGIGAACARRSAADGARVVLVGRRPDRLETTAGAIRAGGGTAVVAPADLTDPDEVQALADLLAREVGTIDVLINNAGAPAAPAGAGLRGLAEAWLTTYRVNTLSAVLMTTALEPHLRDVRGRIVVVGSRAATTGAATASYTAAKAALEGYVRATAARLGPRGITVNVVAPGFTEDTELTLGRISPQRRESLLASVSVGRPGRSDEIAAAVAFLAAPDAGYVTGEIIAVDGGYAPWRGRTTGTGRWHQ